MDIKEKAEIAKNTAKVAGAFCLVISLLLILNFWQMHSSDPLESDVLETLVERLSLEPGNQELINQIRELDLLARKAYFTSLWQVRTGGYLLLFASIILIISLRIHSSLLSRIEKPDEEDEDIVLGRALSRKWILGGTAIMVLVALAAAFSVSDPLKEYMAAIDEPAEETIERISISDAEPTPAPAPDEDSVEEEAGEVEVQADERPEQPVAATPATARFPNEAAIRQNHNAFRGPWGNGVIYHTSIPMEWDGESGNNIRWKVKVPVHAFSSPVIWGDRLFLTGADETRRVVFCFNRHSGNILWEEEASNIPGSPRELPRTTDDTGLGAPTVTTNGIGVYAIFGTGDVMALDMEGNRIWARNLSVPDNHYGHSSSLLTHNEKLFVQYDTRDGGRIICLNVANGETIWDITRESGISWASPILANIDGNMQLVVNGIPIVAGYNIENGNELWSVQAMGGEVGPSPAYGGGLVYAANEYARLVAIDPGNGEVIWEDNYYLPEVASPVYSDGLLFISTTYAVFACFDAQTGEFLWDYDTDDIFYSSPLVANGHVYVTDTGGKTYIFRVGREPQLVATNSIGEEVYTIPAFADGRIYIRGEEYLYCIEN